MLLKAGNWQGSGSWLEENTTQNLPISCAVKITESELEFHIQGSLGIKSADQHSLRIRVVSNDLGTYTLEVFWREHALSGTAKLESEPNMGMLWSESAELHVAFSFFLIDDGVGCRGFVRIGKTGATWEMALRPEVTRLSGNVVSMRRRR